MKPRNGGDGLSGRVQNSGWAWRPTMNGWSVGIDGQHSEGSSGRCQPLTLQLSNLHPLATLVATEEEQPLLLDPLDVSRVDLVAVTVALPNDIGSAVQFPDDGPVRFWSEHGRAESEPHGAAEVSLRDLGHEDDDGVGSVLHKLSRVCVCRPSPASAR